jgi:hypothetical protein
MVVDGGCVQLGVLVCCSLNIVVWLSLASAALGKLQLAAGLSAGLMYRCRGLAELQLPSAFAPVATPAAGCHLSPDAGMSATAKCNNGSGDSDFWALLGYGWLQCV